MDQPLLARMAMGLRTIAPDRQFYYDVSTRLMEALSGGLRDVFPTGPEAEANLRRSRLRGSVMRDAPDAKDDALREAYRDKLTNLGLAGLMAGPGAKTADLKALHKAEEMRAAGIPDREIWNQTGWTFGFKDGKPRFEIPDNTAGFRLDFDKQIPSKANNYATPKGMPLGEAYSHNPLYKAYPDIPEKISMNVGKQPDWMPDSSATGAMVQRFNGTGDLSVRNKTAAGANSTTIHELQHAIQNREKFQSGGMEGRGGLSFDDYKKLAGEVEARLAQARLQMTPAQRRATYPLDMMDTILEQQLMR